MTAPTPPGGGGSFPYSVQAIWTAAQHRLPIVFVMMRSGEYSNLKSLAVLEQTLWGAPGLDVPGLNISIAEGFGCRAVNTDSTEKLAHEFTPELEADGAHRHRGADSTPNRSYRLSAGKGCRD